MAYRRFSLPALKLTRRPASGGRSQEDVHRGIQNPSELDDCARRMNPISPDPSTTILDTRNFMSTTDNLVEPTGHELQNRSLVAGWEGIRSAILRCVTEAAAMPVSQLCPMCEEAASMRCRLCGPRIFFCQKCFQHYHARANIFHIGEKWEVNHYVPFVCTDRHIDVRPHHLCTIKKEVSITCVDEYGIEHKIFFATCGCESLAITLARAELWPATPCNPHLAFTFALLDLAEALMLECQVALKDFCNSLKFLCPFSTLKRKNIYSSLINPFEEYRYLKHKLRHLDYLSEDLDRGNVCPACPQDGQHGGKYVCSMDALFGLPRKKSAGISYGEPLHGELFFCDQSSVDQFVSDSVQSKRVSAVCNDFLAGSMLRSAGRYKALDETAVFGYCCRHEFPGKYINLKHGERLAYAVWMLENILELHPKQSEVFVMYDIACTLVSHLKAHRRSDILSSAHLCLPTFHSYGHKASCQVLFGPRRCEGIGLSDGETMERLWSYLRRFARMTKEMRPAHRSDVLTSALIFYGMQTKDKLASLLVARWDRATKTKIVAEETLYQLMPLPYHEIEVKVAQWLCEEATSCSLPNLRSKPLQWQVTYHQSLQKFYSLRNGLSCGSTDYGQLTSLDKTLLEMEKQHSIPHRWLTSDKEYQDCESSILFSKKEQLLLHIWKAGQRRMFLLKLKKKYADGQKIAKKLSSQISKESTTVRGLLEEYRSCEGDGITLSEALDPMIVGSRLQELGIFSATLACGQQREIIDTFLSFCRSTEEIIMLKQEAENVVSYYKGRQRSLLRELGSRGLSVEVFERGGTALLHLLLQKNNILLERSSRVLTVMSDESTTNYLLEDNSDDSSDCSSDDS